MFLLSRKIHTPAPGDKPDPLEVTFKLKQMKSGGKKKTIHAWKLNVMRFYKIVDNVNTVLFKQEDGPRITVNVVDVTELRKKNPGADINAISTVPPSPSQVTTNPFDTPDTGNPFDTPETGNPFDTPSTGKPFKDTKTKAEQVSTEFVNEAEDKKMRKKEMKDKKEKERKDKKRGTSSHGHKFSEEDKSEKSSTESTGPTEKSSPKKALKVKKSNSLKRKFKKKTNGDDESLSFDASESVDTDVSSVTESSNFESEKSEAKVDMEAASEMDDHHEITSDLNLATLVDFDATEATQTEDNDDDDTSSEVIEVVGTDSLFSVDTVIPDTDNFDRMYKVIIIGNSNVGKSSVLARWIREDYVFNLPNTVHVELSVKTFKCDGMTIKIQFWDTAGQERFKAMTKQYFRGAHGAVIVYDITNRESYDAVSRWISDVREANSEAQFLLIGNKNDIVEKREVPTKDALEFSKKLGISFLETSAKTGTNCNEAMKLILQDIHKNFNGSKATKVGGFNTGLEEIKQTSTIKLQNPPSESSGEDDESTGESSKELPKKDCKC